jgi:hypothetical protein
LLHLHLIVHIRDAIIAGSIGRMAMLLLIYGGPLIGLPRIDVVSTLGSLAAPNKQDAVTLGGAIHFTMGIFFAMIYAALWSVGIGSLVVGADLWWHSWHTDHTAASGYTDVSSIVRINRRITGDARHLA